MRLVVVFVVVLLTPSLVAHAQKGSSDNEKQQTRCRKPKGPIKVEFTPELELTELVRWASALSCETIVVPSQLSGRKLMVGIIAPKRMSTTAAWSLFQVALRSMKLAAVSKSGALVLVESAEAKRHSLPLVSAKGPGRRGLARALVTAEHLSATELSTVLKALKSKDGEITPLESTDMVLVTDYKDHLAKMAELLAEVDRGHADHEGIYVVAVKHADVAELAGTITAILGAGKSSQAAPTRGKKTQTASVPTTSGPTTVIAEPRTKSILMVASRSEFARASSLIRRLDVKGSQQSSHVHMVELEHADAEELATTLNALLGTLAQNKQESAPRGTPTRPTRAGAVSGAVNVEGEVRVTHDGPTNSLLVSATMSDFLGLREIIRRLDTTRPQVYIEATIMEVSISGGRELGTSYHFGGETGSGTWITGLQQDDLQSTNVASLVGASGLLGGIFGSPLVGLDEFLGQSIPSFGVLFQAIATSRRANLISSPRIMTSDNTPATIKVSESRREEGATVINPAGGSTQTPQTVEATLSLKVTPHVNATSEVKLEIELVLEEFLPSRQESLGSDKSSREIINTVVVRDQESIIIGGLMVERDIKTESKVPLLGDIPFLGFLFKSQGAEKEKRNLIVLLTPYVLDSRADHDHVVRRAMAERSEFMRAHTQLQTATAKPDIDYRKKRGLLETINQRAKEIERQRAELERANQPDPAAEVSAGPF